MGKMRCGHCGRKVDSGFDFCPSCGWRLEPAPERRSSGSARAALIILLSVIIISCATVATVWLVRENDREIAARELVKQRRDSLKAAQMAKLRLDKEREDSMHIVAEAQAQRLRLESQMFTIDDFLTFDGAQPRLKGVEKIVVCLRERGYSTLRREAGGRCVVMGLNAAIREGKIAGQGETFSAAGIWNGRIEVVFSSKDLTDRFMETARRRGFTGDIATTMLHRDSGLRLVRRADSSASLSSATEAPKSKG